jgi:formamidopyrimidine-DNA glycosylase
VPELPEVEVVRLGLAPELAGQTITDARLLHPGPARDYAADFAPRLEGCRITGVSRRGKLLILNLDPEPDQAGDGRPPACHRQGSSSRDRTRTRASHLAVHLKMTGRLWLPPPGHEPDKHTHVVLVLDNGRRLHFRDVRRFGYCLPLTAREFAAWSFLEKLGPEPLEISPRDFAALFATTRRPVKSALLDQETVAGIGNIYADESLFRARIHPAAVSRELAPERLESLHGHLVATLEQAIRENGSSFSDYVNARGDAGSFQNSFAVYGRKGKPCIACGRALESAVISGRTTVYCPQCQAG